MIKAGFMLEITSWECDADNYNTIQISGLTKEKTQLYVKIIKLFGSQSHNQGGFGNLYGSYDSPVVELARDAVTKLLVDFDEVGGEGMDERSYAFEEISEYMTQFLGSGEGYVFRTYSSHEVYFVPVDIEEVTGDFN